MYVRVRSPPPQVRLHSVYSDHSPSHGTGQCSGTSSHGRVWSAGHVSPPNAGEVPTVNVRVCVPPPPHSMVQDCHSAQAPSQSIGHSCELHSRESVAPASSRHETPPALDSTLTTNERVCSPPPQDRLHVTDHGDHSPSQSTGQSMSVLQSTDVVESAS